MNSKRANNLIQNTSQPEAEGASAVGERKARLRREFRRRLSEPSADVVQLADLQAALNQRLAELLKSLVGKPSAWAAYQPLAGVEPDIRPTLGEMAERGLIEWAFPRIEGDELAFYSVQDLSALVMNRWGILEPDPARAVGPCGIDEFFGIVVPGVAFDHAGNRLGRGRGFYDRALSKGTDRTTDQTQQHQAQHQAQQQPQSQNQTKHKTIKIGVAFERQMSAETLPVDEWDQRMDWVVTESRTLNFGADQGKTGRIKS